MTDGNQKIEWFSQEKAISSVRKATVTAYFQLGCGETERRQMNWQLCYCVRIIFKIDIEVGLLDQLHSYEQQNVNNYVICDFLR